MKNRSVRYQHPAKVLCTRMVLMKQIHRRYVMLLPFTRLGGVCHVADHKTQEARMSGTLVMTRREGERKSIAVLG